MQSVFSLTYKFSKLKIIIFLNFPQCFILYYIEGILLLTVLKVAKTFVSWLWIPLPSPLHVTHCIVDVSASEFCCDSLMFSKEITSHWCLNSPNLFCYIYGNYVVLIQRQHITDVTCIEDYGTVTRNLAGIYLQSHWGKMNHVNDCYFCLVKMDGNSSNNTKDIVYPDIFSAIWLVLHGENLLILCLPAVLTVINEESNSDLNGETKGEINVCIPEIGDSTTH